MAIGIKDDPRNYNILQPNNTGSNFYSHDAERAEKFAQNLEKAHSTLQRFWQKVPVFIRGETPGGEEFINRFGKNLKSKDSRPKFQMGLLTEIIERARRSKTLIFLYLEDHKDKLCKGVDKEVMTNPEVLDLLNSFISFGANTNTQHGKYIQKELDIKSVPAICVLKVTLEGGHSIVMEMEGEKISVEEVKGGLKKALDEFREERKKESERMERERAEVMMSAEIEDEEIVRMRSKMEYEEAMRIDRM